MKTFANGARKTGQAGWQAGLIALAIVAEPCAAPSSARAEQVGTAVVDGRMVILDRDGTWTYSDAEATSSTACKTVENVEFCTGTLAGWKASKNGSSDFVASYDNSAKGYYFGFISEPTGSDDGITYDALRAAILENAADASGSEASAIPVLATEDSVPGLPGMRSIMFQASFNGAPVIFYNCYVIKPAQTIQFAFWKIGKQTTPDFTAETRKFLSSVKLK